MDDDDSFAWPADEQEAQADTNAEAEPTASSEESVDDTTPSESDNVDETGDAAPAESPADSLPGEETAEPSSNEQWTFPVRAAPILALQGEEVVEFPLSQHRNGTESTSLVMDDRLMRIVEARYDSDGVRRLNVRMALVKEHISGYSHTHLDLFQKLQPVWWGAIGFGLLMATGFAQSLLALGGGAFVLTGVAGLLMAQLDLHRISFSDHGGRHDFYLSGWRQEPYLIHNSTALLGPAFVDFLRTSELETKHIDAVIDAMAAPPQPAPALPSPPPSPPTTPQLPPPPASVIVVPASAPAASAGPPISVDQTASSSPLPPPPSAPLPPPVNPQMAPPPPTMVPASMPAPATPVQLPPAPLPPAPLPPPPPSKSQMDEDALWGDLS